MQRFRLRVIGSHHTRGSLLHLVGPVRPHVGRDLVPAKTISFHLKSKTTLVFIHVLANYRYLRGNRGNKRLRTTAPASQANLGAQNHGALAQLPRGYSQRCQTP
jgi:hypothetical protein